MGGSPWQASFRWRRWRGFLPWLLLVGALGLVRWSKGSGFADAYALLSRPFWPGAAQREWIQASSDLEQPTQQLLTLINLCSWKAGHRNIAHQITIGGWSRHLRGTATEHEPTNRRT